MSKIAKIYFAIAVLCALINPLLVRAEVEIFPSATSTVGVDFSSIVTSTVVSDISDEQKMMRTLISQPRVRVGLYKTSEPVVFMSDFSYEVWVGNISRMVIAPQERVTLMYKNGQYIVESAGMQFGSQEYVRLVPQQENSYFTLDSYTRLVAGRSKVNFNVYRDVLEYRFSPKSKLPYIINELPLDMYVWGVAETHDGAATEYLKALSVAVRSYANALIGKTPATEKRLFDVYATTADQLYLGYNSEQMMVRFVGAAKETAGELVLYQDNPVITFYFSHSNGKTKSGGINRPWLKSVVATYDKGKRMLGHGIGMSNADAQQRAAKDGWQYKEILQHYYTSTTVERVF